MVFQGSFKKFFRVLHENFKGVSMKIEGCFQRVFSGFQGYLKEIQREFQGSFKCISRVIRGNFKDVPRKFLVVSRKFKWCFKKFSKGVSRKI